MFILFNFYHFDSLFEKEESRAIHGDAFGQAKEERKNESQQDELLQ